MAPIKLEKKLMKEEKVKKAITIEKKKEIVQTYESSEKVETIVTQKQFLVGYRLSQGEKGHQTANCCFW